MKKEERLHCLFGGIDEELIADADRAPRTALRVWLPRIAAAAAAVALTVGLATGPWWQQSPPPIIDQSDVGSSDTSDETGDVSADTQTGDVSLDVSDVTDASGETGDDTTTTTTTTTTTIKPQAGNTTTRKNTTMKGNNRTTGKPTATAPAPQDTTTTRHEIAYVKKWDEKSIVEKFPSFDWNNTVFDHYVREHPLLPADELVGDYITDVTATGQDVYTDIIYTETVHLYAIQGISTKAAVAIRYGDDTVYYPAFNADYTPATLGDLIDDLNLAETMTAGNVYFEYRDGDNNFHDTRYSQLPAEKLWELLADRSLPNVYDQQMTFYDTIDISVHLNLFGISHVLSLDESGYLFTNMLSTGKAFYVGEDVYTAFVAYVQNNLAVESDRVIVADPSTEGDDATGTSTSKGAQPPTVTGTTTIKLH